MRTYTALVLVTILVAGETVAQTPLPLRCSAQSAVSKVIHDLEVGIIFKQIYLSEEWLKKLKEADNADIMTCLDETNAMLNMARENIQLGEEIDDLKRENALLKSHIGRSE